MSMRCPAVCPLITLLRTPQANAVAALAATAALDDDLAAAVAAAAVGVVCIPRHRPCTCCGLRGSTPG